MDATPWVSDPNIHGRLIRPHPSLRRGKQIKKKIEATLKMSKSTLKNICERIAKTLGVGCASIIAMCFNAFSSAWGEASEQASLSVKQELASCWV